MPIRIALALLALALPGLAPAAGNVAATVDFVEGEVRVSGADKVTRTPAVGDTLSESDTVETGRDGELHAKMQDGGYLAIRPSSKVLIQRYQANGEASDTSVLSLLQGGFRSITGWIGRTNPKGYQVRAGAATIGIRGTDHETHYRLKGDSEGEAGVYDRVHEGGTFIRTAQGRVEVAPGRAAFWNPGRRLRPRLLDRVPAFFRGTRNERRLEGLHQRLQPLLEQRREERRTLIKQRVANAKQAQREKAAQDRAPREKAVRERAAVERAGHERPAQDKAAHEATRGEKLQEARETAKAAREQKAKAAREDKDRPPRP